MYFGASYIKERFSIKGNMLFVIFFIQLETPQLTVCNLDRFIVVWGHHCFRRILRYVTVAFHRQFRNALEVKKIGKFTINNSSEVMHFIHFSTKIVVEMGVFIDSQTSQ